MFRGFLKAVGDTIVANATSPTGSFSANNFFLPDAGPAQDPNLTVQELSGGRQSELVSKYKNYQRHKSLILHGPLDRTLSKTAFNVILHVPVQPPSNRELMFSLIRTDSLEEAQRCFIIFKECLVPLVDIDTQVSLIIKAVIY